MSRLIDRGELFNRLATVQDKAEIFQIIQEMPTVDLVQCKDCIYWCATVTHSTLCDHYDTPDAFCSHGERRTE